MSASQNIPLIVTFILSFCLCSCEKSVTDDRELFPNTMPIDSDILGEWHRSFSVRGDQNSITVFTDSLRFNTSNFGSIRHYKFHDLWFCDTFQFYNTADSTIFLKSDEWNETWTYAIRNDSLFVSGTIPYIR
jgi:hypothetical protein